ncbi:unnamed protein product [Periconia digitata]|uniref:Mitochondrial import inner membrane translocase subunit TIM50 n=1 Tax=Periconia digitata TaxID=1303443 RepID=A0A9W4U7W7_9PLEO|nr:unnamed protein product [Periconia digitata]
MSIPRVLGRLPSYKPLSLCGELTNGLNNGANRRAVTTNAGIATTAASNFHTTTMTRGNEHGDDPSSISRPAPPNNFHAPSSAQTYSTNGPALFGQNYPPSSFYQFGEQYPSQQGPQPYWQQWSPTNYYGTPQYPVPAYSQTGPATSFFSPNVPMPSAYPYPGYPTPFGGLNAQSKPFVPQDIRGAGKWDSSISNDEALRGVGASTAVEPSSREIDQEKNRCKQVVNSLLEKDVLQDIHKKEPPRIAKIMLPAPLPSNQYLAQALCTPEVHIPPERKLVILDLNGTLIYRPDSRKKPKKLISRPNLPWFLQYLFENFDVMIWSSAKPENVKALVEIGLREFRFRLVAEWARDTLGLRPEHYHKRVQCYKNLNLVWASGAIQRHAQLRGPGRCYDQRNTILIDDSALKASAQPYNLVEIPEFQGEVIKQDILGEVAGYLELLKMQQDVSKFIKREPFRADGTWMFDFGNLKPVCPVSAEGGGQGQGHEPAVLANMAG